MVFMDCSLRSNWQTDILELNQMNKSDLRNKLKTIIVEEVNSILAERSY